MVKQNCAIEYPKPEQLAVLTPNFQPLCGRALKRNTEDLEGRSLPAAGLYFLSPIKALCCIFSAARRCAAKPTNSSRLHSPASLRPLRPGVLSSTDTTENLEIQLNNFSDAVLLPPAYYKYFLFRGVKKKKSKEKKRNCRLRFHCAGVIDRLHQRSEFA